MLYQNLNIGKLLETYKWAGYLDRDPFNACFGLLYIDWQYGNTRKRLSFRGKEPFPHSESHRGQRGWQG